MAVTLALLLGACGSLLPAPPPAPALYDFGPLPAVTASTPGEVALADVSAPAWYARSEIHYRLLYSDPTQLRSYADHRWVAPPAELCAARLRLLLGAPAAEPRYTLRLRLESFEQDFSAANQASVSMVLTAELFDTTSGQRLAVRQFRASAPAQASVQGAVTGLSALANQTLVQAADWAQREVRARH
jgi:cholesterol transport system auxiliary component